MRASFWSDRRVLITGHTGFKGAWLSLWLSQLGARVTGIALPPTDADGAFSALGPWPDIDSRMVDVRDRPALGAAVTAANPEVVFHLAAQPLVRAAFADPVVTYEINVMGTVNLLAALASCPSVKAVVVVTTDKVYRNSEGGGPMSEDDRIGGLDPYSSSKGCAELVVAAWRWAHPGPRVATARAGNVIGGGDIAADRLMPDARRAIRAAAPLRLRYPAAIRPWQFVLEPLYGYLLLGESLAITPSETPSAVNFGPPDDACVSAVEVLRRAFEVVGNGEWTLDESARPPESPALRLDAGLAFENLGWKCQLTLDEAIEWTIAWWRAEVDGASLRTLASEQIQSYSDRWA